MIDLGKKDSLASTTIKLSIAIATRNRPESLDRCLRSLRSQSIQPFEVLVSDDSDSSFASETEAIAKYWNCKYIVGPRRGLYANRNHVALACQGTHIRTMDDDHEFPEFHFEKCIEAVKSAPNASWIIGEYLPGEQIRQTLPHPSPGQLHPRGFSVPPSNKENCWALSDGATIYPKSIFEAGNKFVEEFKFGDSYLEFGSRLHWLGYQIKHLESTYIIHYHDPQNRSFMNEKMQTSSRIFAMLCYSFIYQKDLRNQFLCLLEICKLLIVKTPIALQALLWGVSTYRKHYQGLQEKT